MVRSHILVCGGTGCHSNNSAAIRKEFETLIKERGLESDVAVVGTGCFGLCAAGPIVIVYPEGAFYSGIKVEDVAEIVDEHIVKGRLVQRLLYKEKSDHHSVKALSDTNRVYRLRRLSGAHQVPDRAQASGSHRHNQELGTARQRRRRFPDGSQMAVRG